MRTTPLGVVAWLALASGAAGCNATPDRPVVPDDSTVDARDGGRGVTDTAMDSARDTDGSVPPDADGATLVDSTVDSSLDGDVDASDTADTRDAGNAADTADTADTADAAHDPDAGRTCGISGLACCGVVAASCDTQSTCDLSSGMCMSQASACVRESDCSGSQACTGPDSCAGSVCYMCGTAGASAAFTSCSTSAECADGVCDVLRHVCTRPCANAITGDADCAGMSAAAVCTELDLTIGTDHGPTGLCARNCGSDRDCNVASGEACLGELNQVVNRIDVTCGPQHGAKDVGAPCSLNDECKSGICLGGPNRCSAFCTSSALDCRPGMPTCSAFAFPLPDGGGSQIVRICQP